MLFDHTKMLRLLRLRPGTAPDSLTFYPLILAAAVFVYALITSTDLYIIYIKNYITIIPYVALFFN